MRFVMFCHSLISDWNHGNAHFLRGIVGELQRRGHVVDVYEPRDGWSAENLRRDHGEVALTWFSRAYPAMVSHRYEPGALDLDRVVAGADAVLVHEWNDPELVGALGRLALQRAGSSPRFLFHDTHHRAVSDPDSLARLQLDGYDAVLAFGGALRDLYRARGWGKRVFVWHEAADTRQFYPRPVPAAPEADLVWIGNWGDDERTAELEEFLLGPVRALGLRARVYGVRYPPDALAALARAGISYGGWLPNFEVPQVFARHRMTVHVPRRPYVEQLPGIPTIRPFEAMACGIPLCSAPWSDREGLFVAGRDYLLARDGQDMTRRLRELLDDPPRARALAESGLRRVRQAHTCGHRVDELFSILKEVTSA